MQTFSVDSVMQSWRHKVVNFVMDTQESKYVLEKLDIVFDRLKCAAKLNVALGFVLKKVKNGNCRYSYAHKNVTLWQWSKLVGTTEDLVKIKNSLSCRVVIESCTRKGAKTKWKFYKLTNVTRFAASLKEVPMGCKSTVLPDLLLKNQSLKSLTVGDNTRKPHNDNIYLIRAQALSLQRNERLEEETSKMFNLFLEELVGFILQTFEVVVWKVLQQWRTCSSKYFFTTLTL